jgi:NADH-quinone oxidoreductase subunit N
MSLNLLSAILPQLIIAFGIVLLLILIAWRRSQTMIQAMSVIILVLALVAAAQLLSAPATAVTGLLKVDAYSVITFMLIAISALVVTLLSGQFLKKNIEVHDEYYVLLQLVVLGASILVVAAHFASLFLGFELLSIALVGLVGYVREAKHSVETGFKYLILSACASSFMLLGIAFIYSQTGDLSFTTALLANQDASHINALSGPISLTEPADVAIFYQIGILLFFSGIAFKLSLVPFHFWTPDVYQGAPTPVTMLMATVSKLAMVTVLIKAWFSLSLFEHHNLVQVVLVVAVLSMLVGNTLALKQNNIKRLLGYSSIAHMGYLLIVLMVSSQQGIEFAWQSALVYLVGYVLATLSIFMAILLSETNNETHSEIKSETNSESNARSKTTRGATPPSITFECWRGMFWQSPALASLVIISVLSLAGIPLSMGFIGKFYILSHATVATLWLPIGALIVGSGIGLFYYLRLIFVLFEHTEQSEHQVISLYPLARTLVLLLAILGLILGIYPDMVIDLLPKLSI